MLGIRPVFSWVNLRSKIWITHENDSHLHDEKRKNYLILFQCHCKRARQCCCVGETPARNISSQPSKSFPTVHVDTPEAHSIWRITIDPQFESVLVSFCTTYNNMIYRSRNVTDIEAPQCEGIFRNDSSTSQSLQSNPSQTTLIERTCVPLFITPT